jgi:hypothetical protein
MQTPSPFSAPYHVARLARLQRQHERRSDLHDLPHARGPNSRAGFGPVVTPTVSRRLMPRALPRLAPHLTHFVPMAPMSRVGRLQPLGAGAVGPRSPRL